MKLHKRIALILSFGIMAIGLTSFTIKTPTLAGELDGGHNTVSDSNRTGESDLRADEDTQKAGTYDAVKTADEAVTQQAVITPEPTATPIPDPTATPTPIPTPTPVPNNLLCEEIPEIHDLIVRYLNAKLICTEEAFAEVVDDVSKVDIEEIQKRTEAILSYEDVITYTKRGYGDVDYVVYYTYCMDIATIDTPAVSIDSNYVTVDEDGNYKIKYYYGDLDSDTKSHLVALNGDEDVQELISITYAVMEKALANDADLLDFWLRLYQPSDVSADETGVPAEP